MIRTFQGVMPRVAGSAFIEATAVIVGDVVVGDDSSVWFHAVVRGDVHSIRIGARTNIQDLSLIHVSHGGSPCIVGNDATIGHAVTARTVSSRNKIRAAGV